MNRHRRSARAHVMASRSRHGSRSVAGGHRAEWAGTHTRRLSNVTTPGNPTHPVQEVRVEHGGIYVLSHLPRRGAATYIGAELHRLDRVAAEVRELLPDRYRVRVTAAVVIPAHPDGLDVAASVQGVLVLDAASLAHASRWAAPALSTSEVSAVEALLSRQLTPARSPITSKRRRWRLPRVRSVRSPLPA